MATKKRGRPKLAEQDARSEKVMVRFTIDEKEACERAARDMGVTVSTWIRVAAKAKLRN
jgi:antitoxin component of RelBE/YafQ-DinJ toxin-antitoxin module